MGWPSLWGGVVILLLINQAYGGWPACYGFVRPLVGGLLSMLA